MQEWLDEIYNLTLPYFLTISPSICQIKSWSLNFFSFQKVSFLSFTKQIVVQTMTFQAKLLSYYVFQSHTVWLWNFPKCCCNSAFCNLFWDECCVNYKQKTGVKERGSYKFMFSLETVTFDCKKVLQLNIQS